MPFVIKDFVTKLRSLKLPEAHLKDLQDAWERGHKDKVKSTAVILTGPRFTNKLSSEVKKILENIATGKKVPPVPNSQPPLNTKGVNGANGQNKANELSCDGKSSEMTSREKQPHSERGKANQLKNVNTRSDIEMKAIFDEIQRLREEIKSEEIDYTDIGDEDASTEVYKEIKAMRKDLKRVFQKQEKRSTNEIKEVISDLGNLLKDLKDIQSGTLRNLTSTGKPINTNNEEINCLVTDIRTEMEQALVDRKLGDKKEMETWNMSMIALKQWIHGALTAMENNKTKQSVPVIPENMKDIQQSQKLASQLLKEINKLREEKAKLFRVFESNDEKEINKQKKELERKNKEYENELKIITGQMNSLNTRGVAMLKDADFCCQRITGVAKETKTSTKTDKLFEDVQNVFATCLKELELLLKQINMLEVRPNQFQSFTDLKLYFESCKNNHVDEHALLNIVKPLTFYVENVNASANEKANKNKQKQGNVVRPLLEVEDIVKRLDVVIRENYEYMRRIDTQLERKKQEIKDLREQLSESENKRNEFQNRLSKLAGAKLTEDNANIADLSDPNRPTKIAEKYSELYDNEWTDAFAHLETASNNEKDKIVSLLQMLLKAYEYCCEMKRNHREMLQSLLVYPVQDITESQGRRIPKLQSIHKKALTDFMRQTVDITLPFLQKDFMRKYSEVGSELPGIKSCHVFVEKCVELCWFMNLQSPPVALYTDIKPGSTFESQLCKPYTKTGKKIDFVVWPPLLLHKDGDILYKGVVQCK